MTTPPASREHPGCAGGVVRIGLRRPTALLLYHPVDGRYVTTAEVPGFVAEGPAWGTNISGMSRIERTTPQEITVWWKNTAGETATMRYLWDQGRYHALYEEGSQ